MFFLLENDVFISFTGVRNVAFFFGPISEQDPKKAKEKKAALIVEYESDESKDEALTSSQVASKASLMIINDKLFPGQGARGGLQGFRNPSLASRNPPLLFLTVILSQQECNGLSIPEILRFVLCLQ